MSQLSLVGKNQDESLFGLFCSIVCLLILVSVCLIFFHSCSVSSLVVNLTLKEIARNSSTNTLKKNKQDNLKILAFDL